jgi:hypothetical protein
MIASSLDLAASELRLMRGKSIRGDIRIGKNVLRLQRIAIELWKREIYIA